MWRTVRWCIGRLAWAVAAVLGDRAPSVGAVGTRVGLARGCAPLVAVVQGLLRLLKRAWPRMKRRLHEGHQQGAALVALPSIKDAERVESKAQVARFTR